MFKAVWQIVIFGAQKRKRQRDVIFFIGFIIVRQSKSKERNKEEDNLEDTEAVDISSCQSHGFRATSTSASLKTMKSIGNPKNEHYLSIGKLRKAPMLDLMQVVEDDSANNIAIDSMDEVAGDLPTERAGRFEESVNRALAMSDRIDESQRKSKTALADGGLEDEAFGEHQNAGVDGKDGLVD